MKKKQNLKMTKKLKKLLAAATAATVVAFALSACSGGSDGGNAATSAPAVTAAPTDTPKPTDAPTNTPAPTAEPKAESEIAANLRKLVTESYVGLGEDGESTVFLGLSESYGVLAFMSPNADESISYVGAADLGEGTITITDERNGDITFGVEPVENGYILDIENFGACTLAAAPMEQLIEAIEYIDANTAPQDAAPAVEEDTDEEEAVEDTEEDAEEDEEVAEDDGFESELRSLVTEAHMGVAEDGETTVFLGMGESYGVLAFMSGDVDESLSYVGPLELGDGEITITDENNGAVTLGVEEADGGYILEIEGVGTLTVTETTMDQLIEALNYINDATEAQ